MSWDDYSRRRKAIQAVLDHAAANPGGGLPFGEIDDVPNVFADRYQLVLALQYEWRQALWARLDLLSLDTADGALVDANELARQAWAQCSEARPVLRRLLDATATEFAASLGPVMADQRGLITSARIGHKAPFVA